MLETSVITASLLGNPRRISRAEYERLVASGGLDDEPVELLGGALVAMSPRGPLHDHIVARLTRLFVTALGTRAEVRPQCSLDLDEPSVPEPDLAVVPTGDYSTAHPRQAWLVIEVADSSLAKDRDIKAPLYAASAIPEYWIVNLNDGMIEVHTQPQNGAYQSIVRHGKDAILRPIAIPDLRMAARDVLP